MPTTPESPADAPIKAVATPLSRTRKLGYAALSTVFFFGILEGALRVVGFRFTPPPIRIENDGAVVKPRHIGSEFVGWAPEPGEGAFNADGFVGPRIPLERTPGALRIAVVGDSCTEWGDPPYSVLLQQQLEQRWDRPVEVLNAGVTGYTSYQGLRRLSDQVLAYRPDVVLVYFGWNDHWLWADKTDAEMMAPKGASLWEWLAWMRNLQGSRVVQAGLFAADEIRVRIERPGERKARKFRVPLEEYRVNLRRMVEAIRSVGATAALVTAPTDMTAKTPTEEFEILTGLESTGFESPKRLHDAYVETTREVARVENAWLIDANRSFAGKQGLIRKDHIHLTPEGIEAMAQLLAEALDERIPNR